MPTNRRSCCPTARTPASPTIPIAIPADRPLYSRHHDHIRPTRRDDGARQNGLVSARTKGAEHVTIVHEPPTQGLVGNLSWPKTSRDIGYGSDKTCSSLTQRVASCSMLRKTRGQISTIFHVSSRQNNENQQSKYSKSSKA